MVIPLKKHQLINRPTSFQYHCFVKKKEPQTKTKKQLYEDKARIRAKLDRNGFEKTIGIDTGRRLIYGAATNDQQHFRLSTAQYRQMSGEHRRSRKLKKKNKNIRKRAKNNKRKSKCGIF